MAAPPRGPCEQWTTPAEIEDNCPEGVIPAGATPDDLELAAALASQNLYRWTGRQMAGACTEEMWPCVGENCDLNGVLYLGGLPSTGYPSIPFRSGGQWMNRSLCHDDCLLPTVSLPGPVSSILLVQIDGVALPSTKYDIQGWNRLVRTDGERWPCGQNPPFLVRWARGTPIDLVARRMATLYARSRLLSLICQNNLCRIDAESLDTVAADGVVLDFTDLDEKAKEGLTGIRVVDDWILGLNPKGRKRRARVGRADARQRRGRRFTS